MTPMQARRKGGLVWAALFVAVSVLVYPYAEYEWQLSQWRRSFDAVITQNGSVKLGSLANFEWDKVYILRSYDLATLPLRMEIGGPNAEFKHRWEGDESYVVVVYRRVKDYPFAVGLHAGEWGLARNGLLRSTSGEARFEIVELGSDACPKEWAWGPTARCLRMLDDRTNNGGP